MAKRQRMGWWFLCLACVCGDGLHRTTHGGSARVADGYRRYKRCRQRTSAGR